MSIRKKFNLIFSLNNYEIDKWIESILLIYIQYKQNIFLKIYDEVRL